MTEPNIKILTINTWKCEGDYFERLKVMAAQLIELRPDVIVCQECFMIEDGDVSTIDFLAGQLSMHKLLTPARFKKRKFNNSEVNSISGLGIISTFPIRFIKEVELPFSPQDGERKIQIASIDISPEKSIQIINVHLTHLSDLELRMKQIAAISDLLPQDPLETILICGDFNADNNSQEIALLKQLTGVKDAYELGGGKYPRLASGNGFQIKNAIDHIFVTRSAAESYPRFSHSKIVLNAPDNISGIYPSDHPAVLTTLHN